MTQSVETTELRKDIEYIMKTVERIERSLADLVNTNSGLRNAINTNAQNIMTIKAENERERLRVDRLEVLTTEIHEWKRDVIVTSRNVKLIAGFFGFINIPSSIVIIKKLLEIFG
jgi:hypothetical protein